MLKILRVQQGASLVELMIAMAVSLFILAGMLTVTVNSLQSNHENLQIIRLDQELRATMDIMTSEIRRAGYWANAKTDINNNTNSNPFMASATDISLPSSSCILFTYDRNADGSLPTVNSGTDDERYGFRLSNNAVQSRTVNSSFDCSASSSNWENLTDTNTIHIFALQFTTIPSAGFQVVNTGGSSTITVRAVKITLTGNLVSDSSITRTLVAEVKVANDKYSPS